MNVVGILGGTFDPVHNGHSRIALDIAETCALEEVRLVPNARSPLRDAACADSADRLAMLELVAAADRRLRVDERELRRQPPSYTVDSLQSLHDEMPGKALCFIMGMDAFTQFYRWHRWQDIPELAHLVVARRPGNELNIQDSDMQAMFTARMTGNVADLHNKPAGHIYICDVTQVDVSATQVRDYVAKGLSLEGLVAEPVAQYIKEHGLYK